MTIADLPTNELKTALEYTWPSPYSEIYFAAPIPLQTVSDGRLPLESFPEIIKATQVDIKRELKTRSADGTMRANQPIGYPKTGIPDYQPPRKNAGNSPV